MVGNPGDIVFNRLFMTVLSLVASFFLSACDENTPKANPGMIAPQVINNSSAGIQKCPDFELVNDAHGFTGGLVKGRIDLTEIVINKDAYPCMLQSTIINLTEYSMDVTVSYHAYTEDGTKVGDHLDPSVSVDPHGRSISKIPLWPHITNGANKIKIFIASITGLPGTVGYIDGPKQIGKMPWDAEEQNISRNVDSLGGGLGSDIKDIADLLSMHTQASCRIIGMRMRNDGKDYTSVAKDYGCL